MEVRGANNSSKDPAGILLRRAKGEAPSVLMAGSLAIASSLLAFRGEQLLGFAVSYWPTRSGAAFRRCSARASAQSAPLGASLVIGQPLPAAGAGVGTAQLSSLYTGWTRTLARGADTSMA